ncbi:hypothetical protein QM797_14825 [Rhodococcus sp. IEGM 1381]|uniref:hypothetical protein n=1 Tax=Rhodococcus sp. IEGM 1381 TaxID=3047085 RepID=UPI0024B63D96|nr:hypothetical protein [Rhodococcus sp. IEGM 1381]MDI9895997.1 hypothetical protein [Rhodococcus sp. IEGM 1381]
MSAVTSEGDKISSLAAVLEEDEKLAEVTVSVLIDRGTAADKRNLRWDLLPIAAPGGLLHAKVAVLLWENSARFILGSANLTPAGYRNQVEIALAIDIDDACDVPTPVLQSLVTEFRRLVELLPASAGQPRQRALDTVNTLDARVRSLAGNRPINKNIKLAVAPSRPGTSPLDRLDTVWSGEKPSRATVLSPFWDKADPAPAITRIGDLLTGQPIPGGGITAVVGTNPITGNLNAPHGLQMQVQKLVAFDPPDHEIRGVHAKCLLVESESWVACMIGSSNATEAGLGMHRTRGHHELNLWIGAKKGSSTAKRLRSLPRPGRTVTMSELTTEDLTDEPGTPVLPLGFETCLVDVKQRPARITLTFAADKLPMIWIVRTPEGQVLEQDESWAANGMHASVTVDLASDRLPAYLDVNWVEGAEQINATWIANMEDPASLPSPADLSELPVEMLLAALASSRPLSIAIEHEMRKAAERQSRGEAVHLDALRRFDSSRLLLQRTRHRSLALWNMQQRLRRPTRNLDAVKSRMRGIFGPLALADGLIKSHEEGRTPAEEVSFLLAEIALSVATVDWSSLGPEIPMMDVSNLVASTIGSLEDRRSNLNASVDPDLAAYINDAFEEAKRCAGL